MLTAMEELANKYNVGMIVTPMDVYVTEQIALKYYSAPIINAVKHKIVSGLKSRSSKHFTFGHWASVLDAMFGINGSVRRESGIDIINGDDFCIDQFSEITSKYLITDYSMVDAEAIYDTIHKYTTQQIKNAVSVAKGNNVYNIQYIKAVLEKDQALSNIKKAEQEKMREKINSSNSILNRQKVQNSAIDVAVSQYNWEEAKKNAELERMMQEKFGK